MNTNLKESGQDDQTVNLTEFQLTTVLTFHLSLYGHTQQTLHYPSYDLHGAWWTQGRIQDFYLGGGRKILCVSTHITSTKTEVPFGRGPGPA